MSGEKDKIALCLGIIGVMLWIVNLGFFIDTMVNGEISADITLNDLDRYTLYIKTGYCWDESMTCSYCKFPDDQCKLYDNYDYDPYIFEACLYKEKMIIADFQYYLS
jgi:hypothetical protein